MRNFCNLFFLFVLFIGVANGQNVPQNVNYQSVIRTSTGGVIPNQTVELKLSVLQGSALGTYVYQEIHTTSTNSLGLVNVKLGDGLVTLSSFNQIDWAQEPFYLKVEIDTSSSGSFINFGESQISSVPYSLYSSRSMMTDSLSPQALNSLPKIMLSGDTLFVGLMDTIVLNLSSYKLTEAEVDSMVSNNGFLTFEKDSSTSNELQTLSINNNTLYLSITGDSIDLSPFLDNSTLSEAQVDTFVSNNGFLLQEVDGSLTNEIQDLIISNDSLYLSNISQPTKIDLSPYYDNTNLSESQVDSMVANNGYLLAEIDGSTTNEIQDLQLSNDTLRITGNSGATSIDLSVYLDDTVLDETQVDNYVSNNGFLLQEVDGSINNEIQDLSNVLSQDNDANNQAIFNVSRQSIGQQNLDTSAVLDVNSTTQGFLPPRMTKAQRNAIYSPAAGLIVWCTDCGVNGLFSAYNGNGWAELQLTNTSGTVPTVNTHPVTTFGHITATVSGSVISNGGASILAKGLCYSKSPNPNITDFVTPTDTGNGNMSYFLNYLDTNTTYYVRAYAQNQNGIGYGSQEVFTTKTTVAVGDTFGGGIVAYILQPGDISYVQGEQHGIIISPIHPVSQRVDFGTCGTGVNHPAYQLNIMSFDSTKTHVRLMSGVHNQNLINSTCSNTSSVPYFVENWTYNGFSDWVLPSLDDLYAIKSNQTIINASLATAHKLKTGGYNYWSSTTFSSLGIFQVSFGSNYTGNTYNSQGSNSYFVPVRYF